jgi:hypothetical protein
MLRASVCGPLLGGVFLVSEPVTTIVYGPPGVFWLLDTVRVESTGAAPLMDTGDGVNEQVGGGVPPFTLLHESVTVPV